MELMEILGWLLLGLLLYLFYWLKSKFGMEALNEIQNTERNPKS